MTMRTIRFFKGYYKGGFFPDEAILGVSTCLGVYYIPCRLSTGIYSISYDHMLYGYLWCWQW